ncbi:anaerobic ribonucleoside-triphosphate reductase activating protein [Lachnospiraceae bacterium XBB1006]|nr:anaerobic ribonucleoside-triphosphate reductase activating protein [Lachnospiraceae bacterium XBB1006]
MNYGQIYYTDTANGPGCRTVLFVSGCTHHCKGCFNQETWSFSYGQPYTGDVEEELMASIKPAYIAGLTILGGEPMEPANQEQVYALVARVRRELPGKTIWLYSGYTWEELMDEQNERCHGPVTKALLSLVDVLVDGEFHEAERNITLQFRGSENQRIIDVPKSLQQGGIVLWEK